MSTTPFDFASLLPAGLPPAAARWTGRVKFDFTGGNNDADSLPLDGLMWSAYYEHYDPKMFYGDTEPLSYFEWLDRLGL